MSWLSLNGKLFSIKELKNVSINNSLTEFEKSTLKFCKSWLNEQSNFTIHTSGSTGSPKEIILKREAMEASARMTIQALSLKSTDTSLVCLDTKYIAGQMMLVRSLLLGMNIIAVEPTANPLALINQKVNFTALVPYQLESVLEQSPSKLDQVRCAIIGGAVLSNSQKEKLGKSKCAFYATYGMTETISHIALQKLNGEGSQDYFTALENIRLRLDERGCLCIKAGHLDNEIITNDLVELIDSKKFKWLGRIDNVINSSGIKIIPEKLEAIFEKIFESIKLTNRFFIAALPDEKLGQRAVIICEGFPLSSYVQQLIIEEAGKVLGKYELPKEFKFVEKFTETVTGKINRYSSSAKVST
jgi:O-succinylbenzoic acid--CoA ligase